MYKTKLILLFKSRIPKLFSASLHQLVTKNQMRINNLFVYFFKICNLKRERSAWLDFFFKLQLFKKTNKLVIHIWFLIIDSCNETDIRPNKQKCIKKSSKNCWKPTSYFVLKIQMRQFMLWLRTQLGVTTTHWVSKSMWFNQLVIW